MISRIAELAERLPIWMEQADVPGLSIAVVARDQIAWSAGFGVTHAGTRAPVTPDTVFQAASLSKPVVAYAVLRLVDAGLFDLDRPLPEYLPEPYAPDVPQVQTITARQALSHSSGLQNWRFKLDDPLEFAFAPGGGFRYSGEGYFLVQRVLEQLSGGSFESFIQRAILQPLAMTRSSYLWTAAHAEWVASGHQGRGEPADAWNFRMGSRMLAIAGEWGKPLAEWLYADIVRALPQIHAELTPLPNNLLPNAAASLITTAPDYARFLIQMLRPPATGPLSLSAARRADMLMPQIALKPGLSWGLGWGLEAEGDEPQLLWHWGDNMIFQGFTLLDPAERQGVVVFTNSNRGLKLCERIINFLTDRMHAAFLWI